MGSNEWLDHIEKSIAMVFLFQFLSNWKLYPQHKNIQKRAVVVFGWLKGRKSITALRPPRGPTLRSFEKASGLERSANMSTHNCYYRILGKGSGDSRNQEQ